ncbi:MAG: glycosyltransferase family 2 protein [Treponema sp.]|nr:glycosyltransferase family 2 protein [Treponema sp.]
MDVSIIIVNYNTKELLANCLESIYRHTKDLEFEVIVSDNGSTDDSINLIKEKYPQVILIENKENLGFGKANNRGLEKAQGKYIFYLNSDTLLLNNASKYFFDYWENADKNPDKEGEIGALGSNLLNNQKEVIHSYGSFLSYNDEVRNSLRALLSISAYTVLSLFSKKYPPLDIPNDKAEFYTGPVDYITGADLFVKNDRTARFDENFFMYCEEADLQLQMSKINKKRLLIEGPQIIHLCGGARKNIYNKVTSLSKPSSIQFNISRIYYFKKNGCSKIKIRLLKLITLLTWLNPLIHNKTKKYKRIMLSI